jgi:hypothetical protein
MLVDVFSKGLTGQGGAEAALDKAASRSTRTRSRSTEPADGRERHPHRHAGRHDAGHEPARSAGDGRSGGLGLRRRRASCSPKPAPAPARRSPTWFPPSSPASASLVSTGTKNLQEQILDKDLPVLRQALGTPFTATCMKGRGNYLCLHRFERSAKRPLADARRSGGADAHRGTGRRRHRWATAPNRRAARAGAVLERRSPRRRRTASGSECPRYADCFVTRMRQRAAPPTSSSSTTTCCAPTPQVRHHDFGEVIPETPWLVVDEAHQLEDVVTQYFGVAVSNTASRTGARRPPHRTGQPVARH